MSEEFEKKILKEVKKYWYKNESMRDVDKIAIEKAICSTKKEILKMIDEKILKYKKENWRSIYFGFEDLKKQIEGKKDDS